MTYLGGCINEQDSTVIMDCLMTIEIEKNDSKID